MSQSSTKLHSGIEVGQILLLRLNDISEHLEISQQLCDRLLQSMPRKTLYSNLPVKKTGQQHDKLRYEDKFVSVNDTPLIQVEREKINRKINQLSSVLVRHAMVWNKQIPNETTILQKYVEYYYECHQFDQFDQNFEALPSLDINLHTVSNQANIYKACNIFHNDPWPIRFHSKFVAKTSSYAPNQIRYVLAFIKLLAQGDFYGRASLRTKKDSGEYGYVYHVNTKSIPYNRFFVMKLFREKNLLFSAGVEKKPIVKNGVIKRYEYTQYLFMLDILSDTITENPAKIEDAIQRFQESIKEDVAKRDHSQELILHDHMKKKQTQNHDFMFQEYENPYIAMPEIVLTQFDDKRKYDYRPLVFKPLYVSTLDTSSLIFDESLKRWISKDHISNIEQKAINEYQRKVNEQLIKRFVDFESAKTLVELLTKIPNFKVELTDQEKDVIGQNGNVLVIGRSGTGKTTCAVLRLFAIQMLFKIRLSLSKKKYQQSLKDTRCSADDIDKTIGLHCVFLTASPVLTNQIERYYKKLTDNIKLELQKKKKKVEEQRKKKEESEGSMKRKQQVLELETEKIEELKEEHKIVEQKGQQIKEKSDSDSELEVPQKLEVKKSRQVVQQEEEINKELGGLSLQQKIQNENFEEDDDNYDQMKDQLEEKMKKFKSLSDLTEEDYPGFFTVKSFIMMIDGTLAKPFFIRKKDTTEEESQATWHNEKKGVMMIENYFRGEQEESKEVVQEQIEEEINYSDEEQLEHEYLRQIQLRQNKEKQQLTDKLKKNKKALSFEVDYDYFLTYFWPNVRHKHYSARNITPHLVWTEIYSTIKGGAHAHLYPGFYLSEKVYITQSTNSFLTKEEKLDVYETFCQYERWKINNGGYDMMDAVNYMLNFIRFRGYTGPEIHYVMIDEVQDLPHSIVYLLSKTVRYGVFYSGDTAQTIAKGVGFRFCDLKNLFDPKQFDYSLQLKKPIVKQLTVNFRSHNNILQLANSVVSSIQILFPKTIDRLKKQVSNLSGPKPMILAEGNEDLLFYVLCGDDNYKKSTDHSEGLKKPPLEFGCDQVIIVRDQESKIKVPSMLQHALCLTIYEAKGLEFNDVILFNFFSESKCPEKWNLIKFLKVAISEMDANQYDKSVTKHARQERRKERQQQKQAKNVQDKKGEKKDQVAKVEPQQIDVECIVERSTNKVNIKKIVSDAKLIMKDINDFAELCSELKMLYTAITRPKNTLIIYDEDSTARKTIEKLWERLDVVEMVSKQLIEESNKKNANKPESQELKIFKSVVYSTDQSEWKKQGMKMYARGFFEQAMKCFQRSGHDELYKKSLANNIADLSTKKLIEIESERKAIANKLIQYQKMSDSDLSKLKKKLKKDQLAAFTKFEEAGKIFEELQMYKQAGQCYFSGRKYQGAFENFSRAKMNKQAAESLEMLNKYRQASEYYEKEGIYLKVIQCLDMINEWQEILRKIQKFSHEMTDLQKKSLFKKYSALALQELVYEIEFENEPQDNKPENNRVEIIKEEDDDEQEDWDEDEDPEVAAQRSLSKKSNSLIGSRKLSNLSADHEENIMRKNSVTDSEPQRKQSLIEEDKVIKQSVYQHMEQVLTKQEKQTGPEEQNNSKVDESSFADLNESSDHNEGMDNKEQHKQILQSVHGKNLEQSKPDPTIQSVYETNVNNKETSPAKDKKQHEDNSFAELNQSSSSFADLNSEHSDYNSKYPAELEPDIESIRSMADPEDPWVQSALSEIPAKTNTEYSIIDEQQNYNPNVRIIKTKGNIVVQDEIMTKIVNIVAIVNDSVDQFFKQFKGYQSLASMTKSENSEDIIDNRPEISEFQDVDPKFINIILDTLESFKLYKLCLFVCNRYHLPHKAGRYLISMALKYATNSQINNTLNPALIAPSLSRKAELEKGILASIALHAMFENVSPDFLKIKVHQYRKEQSKNSLGSYFIEGLILEGLYKKAVFMVNPEQSLKILKNFCDSEMYLQMYKQKFLKKAQDDPIQFLTLAPKSQLEEQFTIVKLEQMLHQHNIHNKMQAVSSRYYKEFSLDSKLKLSEAKVGEYTPLLRALFEKEKSRITQALQKQGKNLQGYLKNGPSFKIYDLVSFLTTSLKLDAAYQPIFQLSISNFLQVFACLRFIRRALRKQHGPKSYHIIQSVFSVFFCRMIDPSKSMKFINDGYSLVHRTSTICNEFVEELKKNKNETAFFFQQDYNYVLVKTSKLIEVIAKKFEGSYSRFLRARLDAKIDWVGQLHYGFLATDFQTQQSQYLLKALIREELKQLHPKQRKIKKQTSNISKKSTEKPKFNYKTQGRPELVVELVSSENDESSEQEKQKKQQITNYFIFPDVNPKFQYFADLSISTFSDRIKSSKGKHVPGRLLYCAGLNDTFKEYTRFSEEESSAGLYNAIEFRKFRRLDLYADNLLSAINQLSYTERHMFSAQILIHLLVNYKCLVHGKNFKLDIPRRFLKFFPKLQLVEVIDSPMNKESNVNELLAESKHVCAFSYDNLYSSELSKKQVSDLLCQFLEILKNQESHKCYNIQKFVLIFIVNMPDDKEVYESLRSLMQAIGYEWTHPILNKIRGASDYDQFVEKRKSVLSDKELVRNSDLLHEVRITDRSDIDRDINQSEIDYQIKEKIVQARAKAVHKIITWWRVVKRKQRQADETQIIKQNRIVKSTYGVKYLPLDDHFILRSSVIREALLSFYLRNIVTSSLDYHFILMTLNRIEDLRQSYIKAYASYGQTLVEMQDKEVDFEQEINNIESTVEIWKNDSKWLKDRNIDLKRKKVFEVKWMTKNNVHKMIKKRANLNKQRKLEIKKKFLKKHQL